MTDREKALTVRADDLREQRDEARREAEQCRTNLNTAQQAILGYHDAIGAALHERDEARRERDELRQRVESLEPGKAGAIVEAMFREAEARGHSPFAAKHALSFLVESLDAARAQVVACQAAADDLRHRIEALVIALEEAEIADMIDHHSGDVAALLGPDGAGSAHRAAALDEALAKLARVAVLHQPTDADECAVCTTEDGMSYASPCPTLRAVRAPEGTETGPVAVGSPKTAANTSPDLLGPQIGAEPTECCASGRCEVCSPGYVWGQS